MEGLETCPGVRDAGSLVELEKGQGGWVPVCRHLRVEQKCGGPGPFGLAEDRLTRAGGWKLRLATFRRDVKPTRWPGGE